MIERECEGIYAHARLKEGSAPRLGDMVEATMGRWPAYDDAMKEESCTRRVGPLWQPVVRADVEAPRARWLWSRELARWWLVRFGAIACTPASIGRLAAAVLTPRDLFLGHVRETGGDVEHLASLFGVPQALILLRHGEVTGRPVALIGGELGLIMVRVNLADGTSP